jgi:pimeloyl-ACP methyl ester carboxylesterase
MGGACLLMAAHRHPGLFSRLVVFEPIVFPPSGIRDPGDESPLVAGARRRRSVFPSYEAAIENFARKPPLGAFTRAALEAYVQFGFREDAEGQVHLKCEPETEAQTFEGGGGHRTWEVLHEIETPVLVIAGRVEAMQPSHIAAGVAELLPNGTYLEVPELDHFAPMTHPAEIAALVSGFVS